MTGFTHQFGFSLVQERRWSAANLALNHDSFKSTLFSSLNSCRSVGFSVMFFRSTFSYISESTKISFHHFSRVSCKKNDKSFLSQNIFSGQLLNSLRKFISKLDQFDFVTNILLQKISKCFRMFKILRTGQLTECFDEAVFKSRACELFAH